MEKMFNDALDRIIPLILFSPYTERRKYTDLLATLFDAMDAIDELTFDEIYARLEKEYKERPRFDSKRENSITRFNNMHKNISVTIREHDERITELQEQINRNKNLISKHYQELKNRMIVGKTTNVPKIPVPKYPVPKIPVPKIPVYTCPNCGKHMVRQGYNPVGTGVRRMYCRDGCKKAYSIQDDDFFYCTCGGVLSGHGRLGTCIDCGKKYDVATKERIPSTSVECPRCGHKWEYTGKSGQAQCSKCKKYFNI